MSTDINLFFFFIDAVQLLMEQRANFLTKKTVGQFKFYCNVRIVCLNLYLFLVKLDRQLGIVSHSLSLVARSNWLIHGCTLTNAYDLRAR